MEAAVARLSRLTVVQQFRMPVVWRRRWRVARATAAAVPSREVGGPYPAAREDTDWSPRLRSGRSRGGTARCPRLVQQLADQQCAVEVAPLQVVDADRSARTSVVSLDNSVRNAPTARRRRSRGSRMGVAAVDSAAMTEPRTGKSLRQQRRVIWKQLRGSERTGS